jgi:protein-S-isoprenylcysteine O-methyltransferase Ste14
MDSGGAVSAGLCSGAAVRVGLWTNGARHAGADRSAERLVVVGFYRYVRNPMYVGFITGWVGLWVVFGRASRGALEVAAVAVLFVVLFVRLYEEPTLRRMFGAQYEEYCGNVPRWLPRLRPWVTG